MADYIKIEDIQDVINSLEIQGHINIHDFRKELISLKTHRKPNLKNKHVIIKRTTSDDMIDNIKRYKREIKENPTNSSFYSLDNIKDQLNLNKNIVFRLKIYESDGLHPTVFLFESSIINDDMIFTKDQLQKILNISTKKFYKLMNDKIIVRYVAEFYFKNRYNVFSPVYNIKNGFYCAEYYSLNEIKTNLMRNINF